MAGKDQDFAESLDIDHPAGPAIEHDPPIPKSCIAADAHPIGQTLDALENWRSRAMAFLHSFAVGDFLDSLVSLFAAFVLGALIGAVLLMLWSLTERIPVYLHVYTIVVVFLALTTSANWISSKPRFLLPAVLLALPVARLLAPLRTSVLVPLIGVLTVATTWFGLYLTIIARWTP